MMEITNVILRDADGGEFDFGAEGFAFEIVDVLEDAIIFAFDGDVRIEDCKFEGQNAVIEVAA